LTRVSTAPQEPAAQRGTWSNRALTGRKRGLWASTKPESSVPRLYLLKGGVGLSAQAKSASGDDPSSKQERQMSKRAGRLSSIAIFGHFDGTNLGNEATLEAVLYHLRRIQPDVDLTCICTGPQATAATYHIRAIPIARSYLRFWAPRNPLGKVLRKICVVMGEPIRWLEGIATLWGADLLIVPGTGLLTDAYGLTGWGPYSLLRWSVTAKICRCRLAIISVGAGPIYSAVGKFCVRSILSLADFRSYRDTATAHYLRRIGAPTNRDRVFPDLAFSLPKNAISFRDGALAPGAVIGLGVMEWADRYSKHGPDDAAEATYLQSFAEMAKWLLARGYSIRLLIGDVWDARAKTAFLRLLEQHTANYGSERIIDEPIHSVDDLLSQIAATDGVVATRFHNILLALLCEKPVVSVSFHHKCDSLMAAMGMSDYCLNAGELKPDRLIETFRRLEANADALKHLIKAKSKRFRDALDQQYQLILNGTQCGSGAISAAAVPVDKSPDKIDEHQCRARQA
jgi:polysaccharide pyruvyl transferase WcaK-like protein